MTKNKIEFDDLAAAPAVEIAINTPTGLWLSRFEPLPDGQFQFGAKTPRESAGMALAPDELEDLAYALLDMVSEFYE